MVILNKMQVKLKLLSPVRLFATLWTVAYQAPQSMEFPRQQYWSGFPFPSVLKFQVIIGLGPLSILIFQE